MKTNWTDKIPKSEQTVVRNKYAYKGFEFINDTGTACDYRIVENGIELGMACYRKGQLLCCHDIPDKMKQNEPTPIKPLDLTAFKEQLKIVREKKDSSGNEFNSYGTLNAACWIGEHSGSLIKEIERLREDLTRLQDLAEIAARIAANEKQGMRRDSYSQDCLFIKLEQEMEKVSIPVKPSETYGCKGCGEERKPDIKKGVLVCPECGSENIVGPI